MNNPIVYHTEAFKFEKLDGKEKKYILKGNAMPLNETSRNGVYYRPESVKATYHTLEGVPFLFAHQQNKIGDVLGKVEKAGLNDTHVTYEVEIDPEEKEFIRKTEKGYIKNVSVGVMIDPNTVEFDEKNGIAKVDVLEFAELSSAPVPGYRNTSALIGKEQVIMLAESLGRTEIARKLKEQKDEDEDKKETDDEDKKEESDEEDKKEEQDTDDEDKKEKCEDDEKKESLDESEEKDINSKIEDLYEKFEELTNMMAALSSKVDTLIEEVDEKEEKEVEEEPKEEQDTEDDKKETEEDEEKEEKDIEPEKEEVYDEKAISKEALKLSNSNKSVEINKIQKGKKEAKNFADLLLQNKRY